MFAQSTTMQSSASNLVCPPRFTLLHHAHHAIWIDARFTSEITAAQAKTKAGKTTIAAWSHVIETVAELSTSLSVIKQQVAHIGNEAMTKLQAYLSDVKNQLESRGHQTTSHATANAHVASSFSYIEAGNWLKAIERAFTAMTVLEKIEAYANNTTAMVNSIKSIESMAKDCDYPLAEKMLYEVETLTESVRGIELHLKLFMEIFFGAQPAVSSPAKWKPVHQLSLMPFHLSQDVAQNVTNIAAQLTPQMKEARAKTEATARSCAHILPDDSLKDYFIPVTFVTKAKLNVTETAKAWCRVTETVAELHTLLSKIKQQLIHTSNETTEKLHTYLSTVKNQLENKYQQILSHGTTNLYLCEDFSYKKAENWLRTTEQIFAAMNTLEKVETCGEDIIRTVRGILDYFNLVIASLNEQTSLEQTSTKDEDTSTFQNIGTWISLAAAGAGIDTEIRGMSTMVVKVEKEKETGKKARIKTVTKVGVEAETLTDYVQGIESNMQLLIHILYDVASADTRIK
jgi:truncated hemoglobin YjbI